MTDSASTVHCLRVEGVNLYRVLDDTHDLSTARGAGLLLLKGVECAWDTLCAAPGVKDPECISRGASAGVFGFALAPGHSAEAVRAHVEKGLLTHDRFRHFTFVVDVATETHGFRAMLERLVAMNRTRQFRQATVAPFDWNAHADVAPDTHFDRLAPARTPVWLPPEVEGQDSRCILTSDSVKVRRE